MFARSTSMCAKWIRSEVAYPYSHSNPFINLWRKSRLIAVYPSVILGAYIGFNKSCKDELTITTFARGIMIGVPIGRLTAFILPIPVIVYTLMAPYIPDFLNDKVTIRSHSPSVNIIFEEEKDVESGNPV